MKISQSLLFAYAAAQGEDRWGSTDYYSFNYGFGNNGGRQDGGLAFGLSDNPVQGNQTGDSYAALDGLYASSHESNTYKDQLHYNGLLCWMCDFRLDLATEAETEANNAYTRCLKGGMLMRCRGEQRTCMFEERRRHGVVYSVCTGCKQTDACVAHWRRNQRFTLPFMNFGDMSLRNLPTTTNNKLDALERDQLPNHRPIYIDDECSTYQETRTETQWRADLGGNQGYGANNEVYPMGWTPLLDGSNNANAVGADGQPFTSYSSTSATRSIADLQFTGHRVNLGLSYSKFAYDGAGAAQLNAQLSQWESTCRWCCHARPDTVCNIEMKNINSSPFATKCGNSVGTNRAADITIQDNATNDEYLLPAHDMYTYLNEFKTHIDTTAAYASNQREYWAHLDTFTGNINGISYTLSTTAGTPPTHDDNRCSLSNAVWDVRLDNTDSADDVEAANTAKVPQNIHGKFRFFQPFNIAQSNADYYNDDTDVYEVGPRFWMQMFQRTPQYDLSHWYSTSAQFNAKFPSTGEGRNSAGMDKFAGRGNKSRWTNESGLTEEQLRNSELRHFFQQQTDMVSQENRDFFDERARDAGTSQTGNNVYLKRWDNGFWTYP